MGPPAPTNAAHNTAHIAWHLVSLKGKGRQASNCLLVAEHQATLGLGKMMIVQQRSEVKRPEVSSINRIS